MTYGEFKNAKYKLQQMALLCSKLIDWAILDTDDTMDIIRIQSTCTGWLSWLESAISKRVPNEVKLTREMMIIANENWKLLLYFKSQAELNEKFN